MSIHGAHPSKLRPYLLQEVPHDLVRLQAWLKGSSDAKPRHTFIDYNLHSNGWFTNLYSLFSGQHVQQRLACVLFFFVCPGPHGKLGTQWCVLTICWISEWLDEWISGYFSHSVYPAYWGNSLGSHIFLLLYDLLVTFASYGQRRAYSGTESQNSGYMQTHEVGWKLISFLF